jgi:hypothetical protein
MGEYGQEQGLSDALYQYHAGAEQHGAACGVEVTFQLRVTAVQVHLAQRDRLRLEETLPFTQLWLVLAVRSLRGVQGLLFSACG